MSILTELKIKVKMNTTKVKKPKKYVFLYQAGNNVQKTVSDNLERLRKMEKQFPDGRIFWLKSN
jgi:hypothetical protein